MKPPPFAYERPESIDEALASLAEWGDDAMVLAGGQSLVPQLALRLVRPKVIVDVGRLPQLDRVVLSNGWVTVDALVTHHEAETSPEATAAVPLLADALPLVGHRSVRNRGTVCGSLAHGDPAAELPAVAVAADAAVTLQSRRGTRTVDATGFFAGRLTTVAEPDELVVAVSLPASVAGQGWRFIEMSRRHAHFAIVGVAAGVRLDDRGSIVEARLALAGVDATPVRATGAERLLAGAAPGDDAWREAAERAADGLAPPDDLHGTRSYRLHLVRVLVRRALADAARRAVGPPPTAVAATGPPLARRVGPARAARPARSPAGGRPPAPAGNRRAITVVVNGVERRAEVVPRTTLAAALRVEWQLTGTHLGCEHGACGACTVLIDGASARSCITLAVQADGSRVETVEGLGTPEVPHPLQQACRECHSFQCGFCTPGFLMAMAELLEASPAAGADEIRQALSGNLCRCTGYESIVAGAIRAGELIRAGDGGPPAAGPRIEGGSPWSDD